MEEALRLSGYREPLGLWVRESARVAEHPALRTRELEFSSRGDRVSGRVILPAEGGGPLPAVLLQGDASAAHELAGSPAVAWAELGAAVATVDLPLHGARADQKLLSMLPEPGDAAPAWRRALGREFARQAVIDLERTLDALCALEWIDPERIVYVGFGLGGRLGAAFCALDARIRAAALEVSAGGPELPGADPAAWVGRIPPRPLLALEPGTTPAAATDVLRDFLEKTLRDR
jgi:cephalosporin-C deacetylase-like acetyl esterase